MNAAPVPWQDVAGRLRPFVARRVPASDVDDVVQDVFVRMQRGLPELRDEERFGAWMYQIARTTIADHGRARLRHPLVRDAQAEQELAEDTAAASADAASGAGDGDGDGDRHVARLLAGCVSVFVARLPSPYREAVTLVELEGLTVREAAELVGATVPAMKSRVLRGRAQLRRLFEDCCDIAVDARGKPIEVTPRRCGCAAPAPR